MRAEFAPGFATPSGTTASATACRECFGFIGNDGSACSCIHAATSPVSPESPVSLHRLAALGSRDQDRESMPWSRRRNGFHLLLHLFSKKKTGVLTLPSMLNCEAARQFRSITHSQICKFGNLTNQIFMSIVGAWQPKSNLFPIPVTGSSPRPFERPSSRENPRRVGNCRPKRSWPSGSE